MDETPGENRFRIEVTGGVANTARMYRGNASPVLFDGFWSTIRSGHGIDGWREDFAGYLNRKGGWLEMYDILAVPNVYSHGIKAESDGDGHNTSLDVLERILARAHALGIAVIGFDEIGNATQR